MPLPVIEFQDRTGEILVVRMPQEGTGEFAMGSELIVQDGQVAIFYRDGRPTDAFKPGRYKLSTRSLPVISKRLDLTTYGGKSSFRAYIYFVQLKTFTNLGWGTPTPVLFRDAEFRAVHLRAHGAFSLRVKSPGTLLKTLVGSQGLETTYAIEEFLRRIIVSRLMDTLPAVLKTVLDLPTHYHQIAVRLKDATRDDLDQYGLELVDLLVEAITVPPEVQQMIDRAAGSRALDDAEVSRYQRMAMSDALRDASKQAGAPTGPPPIPGAVQWYAAIGGAQAGPFTQDQLLVQVQTGQITQATVVWRQGMANWTPAGQLPELGHLFGASPPPIPPSP